MFEYVNNQKDFKKEKNSKQFLEKPRIKGVVYRSTQKPRTQYNLEPQKTTVEIETDKDNYSSLTSSHSKLNNPVNKNDYMTQVAKLYNNVDKISHQVKGGAFDNSGESWLSNFQNNNHTDRDGFYMVSYNYKGEEKNPEKDVVKFTKGRTESVKKAYQPSEKKESPKLSDKTKPKKQQSTEEIDENEKPKIATIYQFSKRHREYPPIEDILTKNKPILTDSNNSNYRSPTTDIPPVSYKKKQVKQVTQPLWEQMKPLSNHQYDDEQFFDTYEKKHTREQSAFNKQSSPKSYVSNSFLTFSGGNSKPLDLDSPSLFSKTRPMFGPKAKSNSDSSQNGKYFMQMFKRVGDVSLENFDPENKNIPDGDGYTSLMKLSWNDDDRQAQVEKTIDTRIPGHRMNFNHQFHSRGDNLDPEQPEASKTILNYSFFPEEDHRWPTFEHFPEQQPVVFRTKRSNGEKENQFFKYHYQMGGSNNNINTNFRDPSVLPSKGILNGKTNYFPNARNTAALSRTPSSQSRNSRTSPSHEVRTYYRKPVESNDRQRLINEFHNNNNYRMKSPFENYDKPARETQRFPTVHSYRTPQRNYIHQQESSFPHMRLNTGGRHNNLHRNSYNYNKNNNAPSQTTFFNHRTPSETKTVGSVVQPASAFHHPKLESKHNEPSQKPYTIRMQHRHYPSQNDHFNHKTTSESKVLVDSIQPSKLYDNITKETIARSTHFYNRPPVQTKNYNFPYPEINITQPKPKSLTITHIKPNTFFNNTRDLSEDTKHADELLTLNKFINNPPSQNQNLNPKTETEIEISALPVQASNNSSILSKDLPIKDSKPFKINSNLNKLSENSLRLKEHGTKTKKTLSPKTEDIQYSPTETDFRRSPQTHGLQKPTRNTATHQVQPKGTFSKRNQFSNLDEIFLNYPTIEARRYRDEPLHSADAYHFEDNWQQHENSHITEGDFPKYNTIPRTHFSCREKGAPGYYADPETGCQVFHMCHGSGSKHSFLCPNGTLFSQYLMVCDWHSRVQCENGRSNFGVNDQLFNQHSIPNHSPTYHNQYLSNYGWESKALPTRSDPQNHYFHRKGIPEHTQPRKNFRTRDRKHIQLQSQSQPQQTHSTQQHTQSIPQQTMPLQQPSLTENQFKNNDYNIQYFNLPETLSHDAPLDSNHQSYAGDINAQHKNTELLEDNRNRPKGFNYFTENEYLVIHSEDPSNQNKLKSFSPSPDKIKSLDSRRPKTADPNLANHRLHDSTPKMNIDPYVEQYKPTIIPSSKPNTRNKFFRNSYSTNDKRFGVKQQQQRNAPETIKTPDLPKASRLHQHQGIKSLKNSNHPVISQRNERKQLWPKRDISIKENPLLRKKNEEFLRHINSDIIQKYAEHGVLFPKKSSKKGKPNHNQPEVSKKMSSSESPIYVYPLAGMDHPNNQTELFSTNASPIDNKNPDKLKLEPRTNSFKPVDKTVENKENAPTINITSRIRDIMSGLHTIGVDARKILDGKDSIYKNVQVHKLLPPKELDAKILQSQLLNSTKTLRGDIASPKTKVAQDSQLGDETDHNTFYNDKDSSKQLSNSAPDILSNIQAAKHSTHNPPRDFMQKSIKNKHKIKITSTTMPFQEKPQSFITYVDSPPKIIYKPNQSEEYLQKAKHVDIITETSKRREKPNKVLIRKINYRATKPSHISVSNEKQEIDLNKRVSPNRVFYTNSKRMLNRNPLPKARTSPSSIVNEHPDKLRPLQSLSHTNDFHSQTENLHGQSLPQSNPKSTNVENNPSHLPIVTKNLPAFIFTANHNPFPFKKDPPVENHNPIPLKKDLVVHKENHVKHDKLPETRTTPTEYHSASPTPKTIATTIPLPSHLGNDKTLMINTNEKLLDSPKTVGEPFRLQALPKDALSTLSDKQESEECDDNSQENKDQIQIINKSHPKIETVSEQGPLPKLAHIFVTTKPGVRPPNEIEQTKSNLRSNFGQRSKPSSDLAQRKPYYVHEPPRSIQPKEMHHHYHYNDDGKTPEIRPINKPIVKNNFSYPSKFRNQAQHMVTESSEEHSSEQPPDFYTKTSGNDDKHSKYAELEKAAELAAMQNFKSNKKTSEER
ncbi:uncharacterized protein [Parasteatoda tepidariorum]|uniref:uncharacterized protein n=1 Tax=Parasteatoda tepidariorum TaxID=114398 RepID=UPI0039BCBF5B